MPGPEPASRGTRFSVALRPALPAAGLFIAGVLLHPVALPYPPIWIGACLVLGLAGWAGMRERLLTRG